ncbi:MAG: excinuclease ABC subunit UvrA [Gammaproteobacteria bacterium]|nr:excinuclease ABC subunit UvrA [Gammaproteobacteria bacterium]MYD79866.1 excinuclease ABC subunit UvrA [Gammaproteobacteria bacterium]
MTSAASKISIRGARTHNLQNIDLDIPRDKLVVVTGLSGSGKSSLAFDTLYAEGQRRYVESLSAYARQFLSMMDKPDVDLIEGLSPAISIEQKSTSRNPRSTVGTITEIYDYLRLLFARVGEPRCPDHGIPLAAQTVSDMVDSVMRLPEESRILLLSPVIVQRKGEHLHIFADLVANGFIRARVDGIVTELEHPPELDKNKKHTIEAVVDRLVVRPDIEQRLAESFETALQLSEGLAIVASMTGGFAELTFSAKFGCTKCDYSIAELEPRMFSFNNPAGACPSCDGLGTEHKFDPSLVVVDPSLSLSEGAIPGWDQSTRWQFTMIRAVAKHLNFDVSTPFRRLPKKCRDAILYGLPDPVSVTWSYGKNKISRKLKYNGIIPLLERRYRKTSSPQVREQLHVFMSDKNCDDCDGARLKRESRNVFVADSSLSSLASMSIEHALDYFLKLDLSGKDAIIAEKLLKEIQARLRFLANVGLNYLTLDRSAGTLSGGEAQRIRLASQIGAGLVGVMYILDEPSIGLHQRDNGRLLSTLTHLKDLGNTVIVVEHDEEAIRTADHVIDIGPGPGVHGGKVVTQGPLRRVLNSEQSLTAQYLSGKRSIEIPHNRTPNNPTRQIVLKGASGNNLKNIDVSIPVGLFTCITGVSGSGKSTLINHTLYPVAARSLNSATSVVPFPHQRITGLNHLQKVVDIDQSPIGRTPRSNPATYTGLFTPIRELFARTQEARIRGYKPGRFSFNVKGGRCEACKGDGLIKVEMHFLPDVYVNCDTCKGTRYNRETLQVKYKDKNIHDVLDMTVEEAYGFFRAIPPLKQKLQTLMDVGLSYIRLGQSATTLSGGEAQRVKLSRELSKKDTGRNLYILDEPTTGLHFHDIEMLLGVLSRLRDNGNTVVVIEHNLDVIKTADWIIDMGPEGGGAGGEIVAFGTPEHIAKLKDSHTGIYLKKTLTKRDSVADEPLKTAAG